MKLLKRLAAVTTAVSVLAVSFVATAPETAKTKFASAAINVNYAEALQKSLYFYDANMCGTGVNENSGFTWRNDCHTEDANRTVQINGKTYNVDVSGGYHDAGDHIKFALPAGMAFTTLNLGYYKFKSAYDETGQTAHLKRIMKYETDYLKRCIIKDGGQIVGFVVQVGDNSEAGNADHNYWGPPETQPYTKRDIAVATEQNQSKAEVYASVCVLASAYVNFGDASDLAAAKELYEFAQKGSGNRKCPFYNTDTKTEPSYTAWAAAWLNKADGGNRAVAGAPQYQGWCLSWNDVWGGVGALQGTPYNSTISSLNTSGYFLVGNSKWGSARNNFAVQLEAISCNQKWEESKWQTGYILGDNPKSLSFLVGYGSNYPKNVHHRAANPNNGQGPGSWNETSHSPMINASGTQHVLVGALAGGPEASGMDAVNSYWDSLTNYVSNEVTLDYNASMVGVFAGLYTKYGSGQKPVATSSLPEVRVIGDEWDKSGSNPITTTVSNPPTTTTVSSNNPGTTATNPPTVTTNGSPSGSHTLRPNVDLVWDNDAKNKYIIPLTDLMSANETLIKIEVDVTASSAVTYSGAMAVSANASTSSLYDSEWMAFLKRLEQPSTGWALDLPAGKTTFTFEIPAADRKDVNVAYGDFQLHFWYSGTAGAKVTVAEVRATVDTTVTQAPTTTTTTPATTTTTTTTTWTTAASTTTTTSTTRTVTTTTFIPNQSGNGDINGDGKVGIADLILLAKHCTGKSLLTGVALSAANCHAGNSAVNGDDLLALIKFLVGDVGSLPIQ